MNRYSEELTKISNALEYLLDMHYQQKPSEEEWGWENKFWVGDKIRWAHLEKYDHPKASILHLVIMPTLDCPAPIYGFDLVELSGTITGMFLDFTPTAKTCKPATEHVFENPRPVPEWGDFFSESFVCCKPTDHEIDIAISTLPRYISTLKNTKCDPQTHETNKQQQIKYIQGQRKNPQTYRMLKAHRGEEVANRFINDVLFPMHGLT